MGRNFHKHVNTIWRGTILFRKGIVRGCAFSQRWRYSWVQRILGIRINNPEHLLLPDGDKECKRVRIPGPRDGTSSVRPGQWVRSLILEPVVASASVTCKLLLEVRFRLHILPWKFGVWNVLELKLARWIKILDLHPWIQPLLCGQARCFIFSARVLSSRSCFVWPAEIRNGFYLVEWNRRMYGSQGCSQRLAIGTVYKEWPEIDKDLTPGSFSAV